VAQDLRDVPVLVDMKNLTLIHWLACVLCSCHSAKNQEPDRQIIYDPVHSSVQVTDSEPNYPGDSSNGQVLFEDDTDLPQKKSCSGMLEQDLTSEIEFEGRVLTHRQLGKYAVGATTEDGTFVPLFKFNNLKQAKACASSSAELVVRILKNGHWKTLSKQN
jgi:hypothetical protein